MITVIIIAALVLIVMAKLSGFRFPVRNDSPTEAPRRSEPRDRTARRVYEGYERAHQKNHDEMCALAGDLYRLQQLSLGAGPSYPALPDGEIVEGHLIEDGGSNLPLLPR